MKSNKVVLSTMAGLCTLLLTGAPSAQAAFQDTAGHWAQAAIDRMQGYQIVNGFGGQFRPDDTITRGEMAVVLDHVMRYQNRADNYFSDLGQAFYTDVRLCFRGMAWYMQAFCREQMERCVPMMPFPEKKLS